MELIVYEQLNSIERDHWWFVARRQIISTIIQTLRLPRTSNILEAGCGTGGNLQMLAQFGKVSAIEPHPIGLKYAQTKGDFDIRLGELPNSIPFVPGFFDLVVALDVIEHLDDDVTCLARLATTLRPGGFGIFAVPAFPFLWSRHDERHHHRRRYTSSSLEAALRAAGFLPIKISYFNMFLFPIVLTVRAGKRLLNQTTEDEILPSPAVNACLRSIFATERFLLPYFRLPFGSSVLALATVCPDRKASNAGA